MARTMVRLCCGRVLDKILRLVGRAELPLCPEFLGGAAAPPYQITEEVLGGAAAQPCRIKFYSGSFNG
jgi:hypothetical protein